MTFPVCSRCLKPIMSLGSALTIGQVCACQRPRPYALLLIRVDYAGETGYGIIDGDGSSVSVPEAFQKAFREGELEL